VEQTRSDAPVSAHAEVDVAAEERIVWAIIADIAAWPTWNPSVRQVSSVAELEAGARFRYISPLGSVSCRLAQVDAPREFAWRGRAWTMTLQQACRIGSHVEGSHVSIEASLNGVIARVFRRRLQTWLQDDLDSLLRLLRLEAEVRSSAERDDAARREATAMGGPSDG
jgi:hypothetical protein